MDLMNKLRNERNVGSDMLCLINRYHTYYELLMYPTSFGPHML